MSPETPSSQETILSTVAKELVKQHLVSHSLAKEVSAAALKASGLWPFGKEEYVVIPLSQLQNIYGRFKRLTKMGQAKMKEWEEMPEEVAKLRRQIFGEADFGAVIASRWIPRDIRREERGAENPSGAQEMPSARRKGDGKCS